MLLKCATDPLCPTQMWSAPAALGGPAQLAPPLLPHLPHGLWRGLSWPCPVQSGVQRRPALRLPLPPKCKLGALLPTYSVPGVSLPQPAGPRPGHSQSPRVSPIPGPTWLPGP